MASPRDLNFKPQNILDAVSEIGIVGNCPFLDGDFHRGECRVFFRDRAWTFVHFIWSPFPVKECTLPWRTSDARLMLCLLGTTTSKFSRMPRTKSN
ncbi:hypothetical protein ACQKWADRAFT_54970 [Trichoderma austrokoningii]